MNWDDKTDDMSHTDDAIRGFTTPEYRFLSNFYPCCVKYEGRMYLSSEAAYQAAKTANEILKDTFTTMTASQAKKAGRKLTDIDWDEWNVIKVDVMRDILHDKFSRNPDLAKKLKDTGKKYLEETNWWEDKFWGVCKGEGENNLGKVLMEIREKI